LTEAKDRIAVEQNCLQKELTRIASLRTLLATAEKERDRLSAERTAAIVSLNESLDRRQEQLCMEAVKERDELRARLTPSASQSAEMERAQISHKCFLAAYNKACQSSIPADWHNAALLAKQFEQDVSRHFTTPTQ
jgi:Asp-tRNA(Asn)/Glu-tRNA(Gln) amidotransferase A subunit family amidase